MLPAAMEALASVHTEQQADSLFRMQYGVRVNVEYPVVGVSPAAVVRDALLFSNLWDMFRICDLI